MKIYRVFDIKTKQYLNAGWKQSKKSDGKIFTNLKSLLNFIQQKNPDLIYKLNPQRFIIEEYEIDKPSKRIFVDDFMENYIENKKKDKSSGWFRCSKCGQIKDSGYQLENGDSICWECANIEYEYYTHDERGILTKRKEFYDGLERNNE